MEMRDGSPSIERWSCPQLQAALRLVMGRLRHCRYARSVGWTSKRCTMNDSNYRDEIVRLEAQIDDLATRIESSRKFILVGRIAVAGGGAVLIALLIGAIQYGGYSGRSHSGPWRHRRCGLEPQHRQRGDA